MKQLHYLALALLLVSSPISLYAMREAESEGEERGTTQQGSGQTPKTLRFTEFAPGQKCRTCGYTSKPTPPNTPKPTGTSRTIEEDDESEQKSYFSKGINNPIATAIFGGTIGATIATIYFTKIRR